jgi:hypothetical protein
VWSEGGGKLGQTSAVVGTWLSLVEHSLGVRGVGSSNLPVPTITSSDFGSFALLRISPAGSDTRISSQPAVRLRA